MSPPVLAGLLWVIRLLSLTACIVLAVSLLSVQHNVHQQQPLGTLIFATVCGSVACGHAPLGAVGASPLSHATAGYFLSMAVCRLQSANEWAAIVRGWAQLGLLHVCAFLEAAARGVMLPSCWSLLVHGKCLKPHCWHPLMRSWLFDDCLTAWR